MGSVDVVDASVEGSTVVRGVLAVRTADAKPRDLEAGAPVSKAWERHLVSRVEVCEIVVSISSIPARFARARRLGVQVGNEVQPVLGTGVPTHA